MDEVTRQTVNDMKNMSVISLACLRVVLFESECFKKNNGVRQRCVESLSLFNAYMNAVMKEVKMGLAKCVKFSVNEREWRLMICCMQ